MAAIASLDDYRQSKQMAEEVALREKLAWMLAIPSWARFIREDGDRYWLHLKTDESLLALEGNKFYCYGELTRAEATWLFDRGVSMWRDGKFHQLNDLECFSLD
ncbi:hypothetical protein AB9M04_22125 [Escherichia coli]|uniref:hypothetical protein n=1 Tax=Escherichia coli TaxID=562 RepID=UPI0035272D55